MHATWRVRLSNVLGMSNVTVLLVEISMRCAPVPVCGLKKTYCEPFAPEMLPKSKTRDQFPFTPNVAQNSTVSADEPETSPPDRKSTRLNSSHLGISYAVF